MVRAILQVRERRTSRPQPVPLLRPRPVTRKLDDHVVIRRLDQLVQTAIIRPVHRPRATGRVYRPLAVRHQVIYEHILRTRPAGVPSHDHHVRPVLRHVGLIHHVDRRVFAELMHHRRRHRRPADRPLHQRVPVCVIENLRVRRVPQVPPVIPSRHIPYGHHHIPRQVGHQTPSPAIPQH